MNVRFMGCLHLGHKWMATHRGFEDEIAHDEHLISEFNKEVGKRDLTYLLGDITMETAKHYYQLDRLNGRKIVVLGNHDRHQDVREMLKYVENVAGMVDYKGCVLTHAPIHPNEVGFCRMNIHAHIHHENSLEEVHVKSRYNDADSKVGPTLNKYFNVDAHLLKYRPITLDEILKIRDASK